MLLATYQRDKASLDRARDLTAPFASSDDGALLDTNGWVHFKRGEIQDAIPLLERALTRAPDSKIIHYHLGMAELQTGQRASARTNLEAALSGAANFDGADEARSVLTDLKSGGSG
jgi:tetratricopeptide (TPR) repeat protein